jgi:hypothetical protein
VRPSCAAGVNAILKVIFFDRFEDDRLLRLLPKEPQNIEPQNAEGKKAASGPNLRHSEVELRYSAVPSRHAQTGEIGNFHGGGDSRRQAGRV